jgi:hypothetical protein
MYGENTESDTHSLIHSFAACRKLASVTRSVTTDRSTPVKTSKSGEVSKEFKPLAGEGILGYSDS